MAMEPSQKPKRRATNRWTPEEHARLEELVRELGTEQWTEIAARMPGRTNKQVRQHWVNFQRPDTKQAGWSAEEEDIIAHMHAVHGPSWSVIARCLGNRTENSIKNHWHASFRSKASAARADSILCVYITLLHQGNKPNLSTYHKAKSQVAAFLAATMAAGGASEVMVPHELQPCTAPDSMMYNANSSMLLSLKGQLQPVGIRPADVLTTAMLSNEGAAGFGSPCTQTGAALPTGSLSSGHLNNGYGQQQEDYMHEQHLEQLQPSSTAALLSNHRNSLTLVHEGRSPFSAARPNISPHSSIPHPSYPPPPPPCAGPTPAPPPSMAPGLAPSKPTQQPHHSGTTSSGHTSVSSLPAQSYETMSASEPAPKPASATSLRANIQAAINWNTAGRATSMLPDRGSSSGAANHPTQVIQNMCRPAVDPVQSVGSREQLLDPMGSWAERVNSQMVAELQLSRSSTLQLARSMPPQALWPKQQQQLHASDSMQRWSSASLPAPLTPAMMLRPGLLEPSPVGSNCSTHEELEFDPDSPMGWDVSIVEPAASARSTAILLQAQSNAATASIMDGTAVRYGNDGITVHKKRAFEDVCDMDSMLLGRFSLKKLQTRRAGADAPAYQSYDPQSHVVQHATSVMTNPSQANMSTRISSAASAAPDFPVPASARLGSNPDSYAGEAPARAASAPQSHLVASGEGELPNPAPAQDLHRWLDAQLSSAWRRTAEQRPGNSGMQQRPANESLGNASVLPMAGHTQMCGGSSLSQITAPLDSAMLKHRSGSEAMLRSLMVYTPPGSQDLLALLDSLPEDNSL